MRTDLAILCGAAVLLGACGNHWQLDIDGVRGSRDPDGRVRVEVDTTCHVTAMSGTCQGPAAAGLCARATFHARGSALPPTPTPAPSKTKPSATPLLALDDCHSAPMDHDEPLRFTFATPSPLPPDVLVEVAILTTQGGRPSDYQRTISVP